MTRRRVLGTSAGALAAGEMAATRGVWTSRARAAESTPAATEIDGSQAGGTMDRRIVNPWTWQDEFGFVQAIEVTGVQRTLICSGQASQDANGAPIHVGDMIGQTKQALDNLETLLDQSGYTLADVVHITIYTTDLDGFFAEGMAEWGSRLGASGARPTTTLLGVTRLAYPELLIEFEATAMS